MTVRNVRWSDEEFEEERKKVLSLWPTGKEVDLDEAIAYHRSLPDHKNFAREVQRAKAAGLTLCQPRGGVALIDEHIKLLKTLQDDGGAELLPTTTDTYTRNMKFQEAEKGIYLSCNQCQDVFLPTVPVSARYRPCHRHQIPLNRHAIVGLPFCPAPV